ncbi:MAG: energy-coupling factor transporter ATPase [Anaerolineales bacterium]
MSIRINDLTYTYDNMEHASLQEINLAVADHQFVLVLGPSGCGKSTLSLCLNGLIPQVAGGNKQGHVFINDLDTDDHLVSELATHVGLVFQDPEAQLSTLVVRDEIVFGPEGLNVPREDILRRLERYLRLVGMESYRDSYTFALSGGQKQRVALASVLAMEPQILVLDEPTSNLDPVGASEFLGVLQGLAEERQMSIVAIEHRVDYLCQWVDLVVVMNDGKIVAQGLPRDVFRDPSLSTRLGVWVPQVTRIALAVASARGLSLDPLPLTLEEARGWMVHQGVELTCGDFKSSPVISRGEPHLRVTGLRHSYSEGQEALRGIDLEIRQGDFVAIVGPNGSGKTTLTKHFVGLIRPQQGSILLSGRDISLMSIYDITAEVGYVFQYPEHQFVTEKVYDEIAYSLRVRRLPEQVVRQKVEEALNLFGLEGLADRHPFTLSMGQKRRLSVATMVVVDQALLILDEPTMGLDFAQTTALLGFLERLHSDGRTIIIITHDMQVVAEWARTVVAMRDGTIVFQGSPREFFGQPETLKVAQLQAPPVVELAQSLKRTWTGTQLPLTLSEFVAAAGPSPQIVLGERGKMRWQSKA